MFLIGTQEGCALSVNDFDILVLYGRPALDKEAMRVVIAAGHIAQFPGRDQAAGDRTARPGNALYSETFEGIWITAQVNVHTIDL
jgi:hypothetical protein